MEEQCRNSESELILGGDGYAIAKHIYDDKNRVSYFKLYDVNGEIVRATRPGCCVMRQEFDSLGYLIEMAFLDKNGRLISEADSTEMPMYRYKHDDRGNCIEQSEWQTEDKLAPGTYILRQAYDSNGFVIERAYFDEDGNSTIGPSICDIVKSEFVVDEYGDIETTTDYYEDGSIRIDGVLVGDPPRIDPDDYIEIVIPKKIDE